MKSPLPFVVACVCTIVAMLVACPELISVGPPVEDAIVAGAGEYDIGSSDLTWSEIYPADPRATGGSLTGFCSVLGSPSDLSLAEHVTGVCRLVWARYLLTSDINRVGVSLEFESSAKPQGGLEWEDHILRIDDFPLMFNGRRLGGMRALVVDIDGIIEIQMVYPSQDGGNIAGLGSDPMQPTWPVVVKSSGATYDHTQQLRPVELRLTWEEETPWSTPN